MRHDRKIEILYFTRKDDSFMGKWQRWHIFDELEHHMCHIQTFDYLQYDTLDIANEELLKHVKENRYDLFMTGFNEKYIYIDTLQEMKKMGIPTLLLCMDNLIVPFVHKNVAKYYDLVWLFSKETMWYFKDCNTIFLPYAANPYYKQNGVEHVESGIGFVGSPYGSRSNVINKLTSNDIPVFVHYKGLSKQENNPIQSKSTVEKLVTDLKVAVQYAQFHEGRTILRGKIVNELHKNSVLQINAYLNMREPVDNLYDAYAQYALALATTTARNTGVLKNPVFVINLRSFEIPMAGGVQFCRYFDELAEYFEDGKEAIYYKSENEMIEKAKYYLSSHHECELMKIRAAARKRAEAEHTWYIRFSKVFDRLGIK